MKEKKSVFYANKIKEVDFCETKVFVLTGNSYAIPYEIEQSKGEHSLENCKGHCPANQKSIAKEIKEKFEKFPNCCEYHKKLNDLKEFNKNDFGNIPNSIANKIMFTYSHILNNIENDNWETDIQDYIHYVVKSFGSVPTGFGEPFYLGNYYRHLISRIEPLKDGKPDTISKIDLKKRVNKLLKSFNAVFKTKNKETNLETLLSIYNEWYKIFPFNISYFQHLKEKYKTTLPLHTGRTRYNKYTKETENEKHTKETLTKILIEITKDILKTINGATLYEKGLLTDINNKKIELLINQRKTNLKKFETKNINDNTKYIKALNYWFKGEKNFLKEITPLLKNKPQQKDKNTYSLKAVAIAYFCLGITINEDNYKEILDEHTKFKSNKILQKTIVRTSQLTTLTEDKTADKKHLNTLIDAERLLSGKKNEKATKSIKQFISTFESKFNDFYN